MLISFYKSNEINVSCNAELHCFRYFKFLKNNLVDLQHSVHAKFAKKNTTQRTAKNKNLCGSLRYLLCALCVNGCCYFLTVSGVIKN